MRLVVGTCQRQPSMTPMHEREKCAMVAFSSMPSMPSMYRMQPVICLGRSRLGTPHVSREMRGPLSPCSDS